MPAARNPLRRFNEWTPMASRLANDGIIWSTRTGVQCTGVVLTPVLPRGMHHYTNAATLSFLNLVGGNPSYAPARLASTT